MRTTKRLFSSIVVIAVTCCYFILLPLFCYLNPVYDVQKHGAGNNVTCVILNSNHVDVFYVLIHGPALDTTSFHVIAKSNTLLFSAAPGMQRHIVINGYVSGKRTYSADIVADIPHRDTTLYVALSVVTDPVPAQPDSLALALLPGTVVRVAWQPSAYANGYSLFRSDTHGVAGALIASGAVTRYLDSTVSTERTYYYAVRAYNDAGVSGLSAQPSITIPASNELPETPKSLHAVDTAATSVTLQWDRAAAASSYRLYRTAGGGTPNELVGTTGALSFTDDCLLPVTVYSYAVSAVNCVGESAKSDKITVITKAPVPQTPENLAAKALSDVSIQVSWDTVAYAAAYELYACLQQDGIYEKVCDATECTAIAGGLRPETTYFFKVRAVNSAGSSGLSGSTSAKTLPEQNVKPQTPGGLSATPLSPFVIRVFCNRVEKASHYNIYRSTMPAGPFARVKSMVDTAANDSGLTENTVYYYKMSAENSAGESALSDTVSATTYILISVPTGLEAEALSASCIGVSWNSVTGALHYRLFRSLSAGGTYTEVAAPAFTTHQDTGLASNTTYYYKVSAQGEHGVSDLSGEVSATTQMPPPETPQGLQAAAVSPTQIRIGFNAVANASGYILYWSRTQSGTYDSLAATASTTYDHTGLTPDTEYFYTVCAYNDFGRSPSSDPVSARTEPGELPDAPTGVVATALSSSQIKIEYNAVTGATGYNVYYSLSATGTFILVTKLTAATYTHTGLEAGTEYFYKVTAYNNNGESAYSTVVTAKTPNRIARIDASRCNGCGRCVTRFTCPAGAIYASGGKYVIDPAKCTGCGDCVTKFSCPRGAISLQERLVRLQYDIRKTILPENRNSTAGKEKP